MVTALARLKRPRPRAGLSATGELANIQGAPAGRPAYTPTYLQPFDAICTWGEHTSDRNATAMRARDWPFSGVLRLTSENSLGRVRWEEAQLLYWERECVLHSNSERGESSARNTREIREM